MGTENRESCSQRDSAERKGYVRAHRSFNRIWKERDSAEPDILSKILNKENLNRAYKRVKANKGAPGVDGKNAGASPATAGTFYTGRQTLEPGLKIPVLRYALSRPYIPASRLHRFTVSSFKSSPLILHRQFFPRVDGSLILADVPNPR